MLWKFTKELFWTAFWVFLVLIVGFAILTFISNRFSGNFIGGVASWIENKAQGN